MLMMIMAAMAMIAGPRRAPAGLGRLMQAAPPFLIVLGVGMEMLMGRAVVVVDMQMSVSTINRRHPDAAHQPKDREQRSKHSNNERGGV